MKKRFPLHMITGLALVILMGSVFSAQAGDFADLVKDTGIVSKQTGGFARLIKQGSVIFGVLMILGAVAKFYGNAKESFKEGAKGFITPTFMMLLGGMMISLGWITEVGRASIGDDPAKPQNINAATGGVIKW